jgi:hypothetical protein
MVLRPATVVIAIALAAMSAVAAGPGATGSVQGVVFTVKLTGERSVIPAAKVVLDGSRHIETKSEADGLFAFSAVPPGTYEITARRTGMTVAQRIVVVAGATSEVNLRLPLGL